MSSPGLRNPEQAKTSICPASSASGRHRLLPHVLQAFLYTFVCSWVLSLFMLFVCTQTCTCIYQTTLSNVVLSVTLALSSFLLSTYMKQSYLFIHLLDYWLSPLECHLFDGRNFVLFTILSTKTGLQKYLWRLNE